MSSEQVWETFMLVGGGGGVMKHLHDKVVVTWPPRDWECNVSCIIWCIGRNIMPVLSGDIETVLTPMWRVLNTHIDRHHPGYCSLIVNTNHSAPVKSWERALDIRKCWCLYDLLESGELLEVPCYCEVRSCPAPGTGATLCALMDRCWDTDYSWLTVRLPDPVL